MQRVPSDQAKNFPVPIWDTYQQIVDAAEGKPVSSRKEGTFVVRKETWRLMSMETIQLIRDRQIVDAVEGKPVSSRKDGTFVVRRNHGA